MVPSHKSFAVNLFFYQIEVIAQVSYKYIFSLMKYLRKTFDNLTN